MKLSEQIKVLETHLDTARSQALKLESGTKASASKLRATLQLIKKESQTLRLMAMEHVKSLPTKPRSLKSRGLRGDTKFDPLKSDLQSDFEPEPEPEPLIETPPLKKKRPRKVISQKKE